VLTLFVSDLHLDASRPAATSAFLRFLKDDASKADALYILGDLFEYWVGDDDPNEHYQEVVTALAKLNQAGVRGYFMHGNRDFLVGDDFARAAGVTLLFDPTLIYAGQSSVLISHGDQFCTDDIAYQRYRRLVRKPWLQRAFGSLPLSVRHRLAGVIRGKSQQSYGSKPPEILDVNQPAIEQAMRDHNVTILLHGHTHRPAIHEFKLAGNAAKRIVLGDWYQSGSVLRWDEDGPSLTELKF
jgi:UDP-2,3-diacylglucosamine hydrolase